MLNRMLQSHGGEDIRQELPEGILSMTPSPQSIIIIIATIVIINIIIIISSVIIIIIIIAIREGGSYSARR